MSTPPIHSSTSYPATLPDMPQDGVEDGAMEPLHGEAGNHGPASGMDDTPGDFFVPNARLRGYTESGSSAPAHDNRPGDASPRGSTGDGPSSHAGPSPDQQRPGRPASVPGEQHGHASPRGGDGGHQGGNTLPGGSGTGRADGRPPMPPQGTNPPGQGTWPGNGNGNGVGNGFGNGLGNGHGNGQAHGLGLGLGVGNVLNQIGSVAGHLLHGLSGAGSAATGVLFAHGASSGSGASTPAGANPPTPSGLPASVAATAQTLGAVVHTATSVLSTTTMTPTQGTAPHSSTATASGNGSTWKSVGLAPVHDGAAVSRNGIAHAASSGSATPAAAALSTSGASVARAIPTVLTTEMAHAMSVSAQRGPTADPAQAPIGQRAAHALDNPAALGMQGNPAATGSRAAPSSPALSAIQTGTLTLAFAPQLQVGNDDSSAGQTALFRGQGADGQEGLHDILGRSYVFSADGKLLTRAEERREIDPLNATRSDEINELSASNHGELSTHELVWKVVVPAFVGVGTLLGGATIGVASAAGSTGMAGAFLLVSAAGILGYGTARAAAALREMHDAGEPISPFENSAARRHWLAAGSQSLGSLASLALLLV